MANWDHIIVKCEDENIIKGLVEHTIPMKGVWFREAEIHTNGLECSLVVKNGLPWEEAFREITRRNPVKLDCSVSFDSDHWTTVFQVVFENGQRHIVKVTGGYMWGWDVSDEIVPWVYRPVVGDDGENVYSENNRRLFEHMPGDQLPKKLVDIVETWCREIDGMDEQEKAQLEPGCEVDIKYADYTVIKQFKYGDKFFRIEKTGPMIKILDEEVWI